MEITAEELYNSISECFVDDIRSEQERAYGTIDGAVNIPAEELIACPPETNGKKLVVFCSRGIYGEKTVEMLEDKGYTAFNLKGGYGEWVKFLMQRQNESDICTRAEASLHKKFASKIWCNFTKAIKKYELIKEGDRIAVCISGGKDSMLMAKLFQELSKHSIFPFEVRYIVMDPGYSAANRQLIEHNAKLLNIPVDIFESDIFENVYHIEKSPCYLCARMRRGHLYAYAQSLGCNKIALGHHYDDVIETILMGMLYGAQVQTMMPKLHSTNFKGMQLIRPMYLIREDDIKAWANYNGLHFLQCACKFTDSCTTCNSEESKSKRLEIKQLIRQLKKTNPEVESHIFRSVENVNVDTVICYKQGDKRHHFLDSYDDE